MLIIVVSVLYRDLIPAGVGVCDINEVSSADVVLVAIPFTFYSTLPVHLLTDKIVVDVSNRNKTRRAETEESQAEHLARILPASRVVKSFNVLSAYSLGKFKLNVTIIMSSMGQSNVNFFCSYSTFSRFRKYLAVSPSL